MRLTTTGTARNFDGSILGILTTEDMPPEERGTRIRFVPANAAAFDATRVDLAGYRALLAHEALDGALTVPSVHTLRESDHLQHGDIVVLEGTSGLVRSLYRPYEEHHHLFVTERCNSNCLMCSQPPKDRDDTDALMTRNLDLIELIETPPPYLTITGGEPTLLGDRLLTIIARLKERMPAENGPENPQPRWAANPH